jgi:hypothetical protein
MEENVIKYLNSLDIRGKLGGVEVRAKVTFPEIPGAGSGNFLENPLCP